MGTSSPPARTARSLSAANAPGAANSADSAAAIAILCMSVLLLRGVEKLSSPAAKQRQFCGYSRPHSKIAVGGSRQRSAPDECKKNIRCMRAVRRASIAENRRRAMNLRRLQFAFSVAAVSLLAAPLAEARVTRIVVDTVGAITGQPSYELLT